MKILLSWLLEHLDGHCEPGELAERLTAAGLNVETRDKHGADEVWDVDVTTNRPDAMNHRGLAREAAAAGCGRLKPLTPALEGSGAPASETVRVTVEDVEGCPRYCARVVRGVRVGPSPAALAERLERCGIRPINNVVDATNYVLLELGQPLHAFDARLLRGSEIVVRSARPGEKLVTLDAAERVLQPSDLVIADRDRAIALAGVMGGANTEISAETTTVVLESATFDPMRVRRTARRLGLSTEASFRFERGADRAMAATAADVAAALIARLTGGEVAPGLLDSAPRPPARPEIAFSLARLEAFAGCPIPPERVLEILTALETAPRRDGDTVACTVPGFRVDLELPEDLYEEVLRHFGYDNVPSALPETAVKPGERLGTWPLTERARGALAAAGLAEAFTYSFVSTEAEAATCESPLAARGGAVPLDNPLSARMAVMRRSLLAGLVEAAASNLRRGAERVLLGEVGRVFFAAEGGVREEERLAIAIAGELGPWDQRREADFLDLKGVLEAVLELLAIRGARFRPAALAPLAPGSAAEIVAGDRVIGVAGRAGAALEGLFDVPSALWVAELDLAAAGQAGVASFRALARFPAVVADLTVRHRLDLAFERLAGAARAAGPAWLENLTPLVRYQGKGVGPDEVKTTLRLTYRHPDRSLTQEEVNQAHFALMETLARELGVSFT